MRERKDRGNRGRGKREVRGSVRGLAMEGG